VLGQETGRLNCHMTIVPFCCNGLADAAKNDLLHRFYLSQGWKLGFSDATPDGRRMSRYIYDFDH
jgi:hypothetical protein